MKSKSFDKNIAVTFISGGITVALLACSFNLLSSSSLAKNPNPDTNTVSVELDDNLYNNLSALFAPTNAQASANTPFVSTDDQLFVTIDGQQYPVVETENGLEVLTDINDETVALSDAIGCDNPNVYTDENGNRYYHIVWGDTLCEISSALHYSVDELAEYNHIKNVNLIYAESDLRIPE